MFLFFTFHIHNTGLTNPFNQLHQQLPRPASRLPRLPAGRQVPLFTSSHQRASFPKSNQRKSTKIRDPPRRVPRSPFHTIQSPSITSKSNQRASTKIRDPLVGFCVPLYIIPLTSAAPSRIRSYRRCGVVRWRKRNS